MKRAKRVVLHKGLKQKHIAMREAAAGPNDYENLQGNCKILAFAGVACDVIGICASDAEAAGRRCCAALIRAKQQLRPAEKLPITCDARYKSMALAGSFFGMNLWHGT
jgi:hypothetical protein